MYIKIISFDIWGTLLDIDKFYDILSKYLSKRVGKEHEVIKELLDKTYRSALKARLKGLFKKPVYDSAVFFAEKLGISIDDLFKAVVETIYSDEITVLPYEDVYPVIKELNDKGYILALIGNVMFWPGMITRAILYKCKLLDYIDITLFGDELGIQKPDKRIFEELANKTNTSLNEILHVGDNLINDFAGALIADVNAVLILRKQPIKDIIVLDKNTYVISSLTQLLEILEKH